MKFSTLYLSAVRFFWGVTNLANKYGCSNPCSFRDMTFFVVFFKKFFENLYDFFSQNLKFPTLKLGPVRKISKIANLASKYDCSNPCSFRDVTFFVIFSKIFSKLKLLLVFKNLKFPKLYLGPVRVLSKIANLASKYDCSILYVFEIWSFCDFFKNFQKT